jgi:hypothetical protein
MHTNNHHLSHIIAAILSSLVLVLTACGPNDSASISQTSKDDILATMQLSEAPKNVLSVASVRAQANPRTPITVRGQIGGTRLPFVDGYAGFVLADPELVFCDEMGDDHCNTPWDACCEDPDRLKAMRVSVQFVDAIGNPIQQNLQTSIGLNELDEVVVIGTVAESSTPTNVIIEATTLYK